MDWNFCWVETCVVLTLLLVETFMGWNFCHLLWELIGGKDVEAGGVELGADVCFMCLQVSLSRVCESFYVFHFHESKFELVFLEN